MSAWSDFEEILEDHPRRAEKLAEYLERLPEYQLSAAAYAELRSCATCIRCRLGGEDIERAEETLEPAKRLGRGDWPTYYFYVAALNRGRPEKILSRLGDSPERFFVNNDFNWRAVHCRVVVAAAMVMTATSGVEDLISRIVEDYRAAEIDPEELLLSPDELIQALIDAGRQDQLKRILDGIDNGWISSHWFRDGKLRS